MIQPTQWQKKRKNIRSTQIYRQRQVSELRKQIKMSLFWKNSSTSSSIIRISSILVEVVTWMSASSETEVAAYTRSHPHLHFTFTLNTIVCGKINNTPRQQPCSKKHQLYCCSSMDSALFICLNFKRFTLINARDDEEIMCEMKINL